MFFVLRFDGSLVVSFVMEIHKAVGVRMDAGVSGFQSLRVWEFLFWVWVLLGCWGLLGFRVSAVYQGLTT